MFAEPIKAASTTTDRKQDELAMKSIRKIGLTCALTLAGVAAVILAYLIFPGAPSKSKVMVFEGFIELPRKSALTVLDYLTLNDHALFVTSESSGVLFKIDFDSDDLRRSTVSEMPGAGAAHGVALVPGLNVAFV